MKSRTRIEISLDRQTLDLFADGKLVRTFIISSGEKGMGFTEGSFRTPTGNFSISEKIGDGEPIRTIFKARVAVGIWSPGDFTEDDLILTRILRLDGLDAGNANTLTRCIYIHGTNREDLLGKPASHGCIRLRNEDMISLFESVDVGSEVRINPMTRGRTKLLFVDCDSTLSSIEGIDELARLSNPAVFAEVVALTNAAMAGEIPLSDVFKRRMDVIRPDREMASKVGQYYLDHIVPGVPEMIAKAIKNGWMPVILSGGFAPLIAPLAKHLRIRHVEAVPLFFNDSGTYEGYGEDFPTTRNLGKNEIIRQWRDALLPTHIIMIGDGVSDLETKPDVDVMVGFGGVAARDKVREGADVWITDFRNAPELSRLLSGKNMVNRKANNSSCANNNASYVFKTMSTTTKKSAVRGKRYTAEEKSKIISFIQEYNASNKRGGQSAAAKKFGIAQLTISTWLKGAGGSGRTKAASGKGSMQSKLASMLTLGQDIEKLERELNAKRSKFDALKASL